MTESQPTRLLAHRIWSLACLIMVGAAIWLGPISDVFAQGDTTEGTIGATDNRNDVTEAERVAFDQERAHANMRELEDRMFRLAEMIQGDQPEEADRLRLGIAATRDAAVADRMRSMVDLLSDVNAGFAAAADEQRLILVDLRKLRDLLLQADVDLELAMQKLEDLQAAIEQLESLIESEESQREATDELTEPSQGEGEGSGEPSEAEMGELADAERRNERAAEDLQEQVEQLGGEQAGEAAGAVGEAGQAMGSAAGSLGQGEPGEAGEQQDQALEDLNRAREQLEQMQQEQQERVEALARKRVMENLQDMLAGQIEIRETTERIAPRADDGNPQAMLAFERLATAEQDLSALCRETIEICVTVQFSYAMPPALRLINDRMEWVTDDLRAPRWDEPVIISMQRIESEIEELIGAMKQADQGQPGEGQSGQQGQMQGEMNKILAELRILRQLQVAVNEETTRTELDRKANALVETEADRRIRRLVEHQSEIRDATEQLRARAAG